MPRKIAAKLASLFTVCLTAAMFEQSVQGPQERVQGVRQAQASCSAALTRAAYDTPLSSASQSRGDEDSSDYDFIIKNGRIIDGAGNPWVAGCLAIREGRIATIGKVARARAERVIDAHGLIAARR